MGRGVGTGKTPQRVKDLLTTAGKDNSQSEIARLTGIPVSKINRYIHGVGEPNTETLQQLAAYFKVSVTELRGEEGPALDHSLIDSSVAEKFGVSITEYIQQHKALSLNIIRKSPQLEDLRDLQEISGLVNEKWERQQKYQEEMANANDMKVSLANINARLERGEIVKGADLLALINAGDRIPPVQKRYKEAMAQASKIRAYRREQLIKNLPETGYINLIHVKTILGVTDAEFRAGVESGKYPKAASGSKKWAVEDIRACLPQDILQHSKKSA